MTMLRVMLTIFTLVSVWTVTWSQEVPSTLRTCSYGQICRVKNLCPQFQEQLDIRATLDKDSEPYRNLTEHLRSFICNKEEQAVCCDLSLEIVNGDIVTDPQEFPYIGRMVVRDEYGNTPFCGASLISLDTMITARHCVKTFYQDCLQIRHCYVLFNDLHRIEHEKGQFRIPILDVVVKPGRSDLALVILKYPVTSHEDYKLGTPLVPITLATKSPVAGDKVVAVGWGKTGYKKGVSRVLRKLNLTVSESFDEWFVNTKTVTEGKITDTCKGDSGGPLVIQRDGQLEIVGTLQVRERRTFGLLEWRLENVLL